MSHEAATPHKLSRALDGDNDAIVTAVASVLDDGKVVWGPDGDPLGVTYRDSGTGRHYAADVADCRALLERFAAGEQDAYSHWCAATTAVECESSATVEGCATL